MRLSLYGVDFKKIILSAMIGVCCASTTAMAQEKSILTYTPTSAWLVGPASLSEGEQTGKMPCVAVNQFGNGFVMRLSGGGGRLMAMAIDFRQKAFEPRRKYEVGFSVPGQFFLTMQGAAYDRGTLLFGLQNTPDFYEALKKADQLVIDIAGASVALDLVGLGDGFARMEACYNPGGRPQQGAEQGNSPSQPVAAAPAQKGGQKSGQNPLIAQNMGLTPLPGEEPYQEQAVADVPIPSSPATTQPAGPDPQMAVNAVVNGIAERPAEVKGGAAGVLIAKAQEAEAIAKELAAKSSGGQALAENWANPKAMRPQGDIMEGAPAAPRKSANAEMRFRALKGANLQDVLSLWADAAGVGLIWMVDGNRAVQRSVSLEGRFETAVQSVLEQYGTEVGAPVGRIYREPGSQSLVLVVE